MKQPTAEQIEQVKNIIKQSIQDLISYDSDIFHNDMIEPEDLSEDAKALNRKLHETTINHRIAFYLETHIQNTDLSFYKVDIEYNRDNWRPKELNTIEGLMVVRPDILIHTRMDDSVEQQHFLVVEAKKEKITQHDINKIEGFISDGRFRYLFGLTISYCFDDNEVLGSLFYFNGETIHSEPVNIQKK